MMKLTADNTFRRLLQTSGDINWEGWALAHAPRKANKAIGSTLKPNSKVQNASHACYVHFECINISVPM